ncbi:MAG TPA: DegQ family serine endoprotease [Bryobacteraceae bacterium]|nr:DegQ family serine endoprotease [Bryobacteraceae bacterium]
MNLDFFSGRPTQIGKKWLASISLGAILAATAIYGATTGRMPFTGPTPTIKVAQRSEAASGRGYSAVVKRVVPAVVNISTSKVIKQQTGFDGGSEDMPRGMDPFFRQFFGNDFGRQFNVPRERAEKALGSGVIISPEGYILTNNHVVDDANSVVVTLHDKREFKARVIGTDARTDIAVIKIDGGSFPSLTLGDSSKVEVGDIVLAIGNPFGVGQTVTSGIVSATGRGGLGIEQVEDFIQTDAPINPGNSGGALVDDEGHLIGINTAILAGNSGGNQGIGFAVPINMARSDMDQIIAHGKVEHGYMGILPQDVTPSLAKAFNAKDTNGALVGQVTPDSPASRSDLKRGDIIVAINGEPISDANQLRMKIGMMAPNSTANFKVMRNGQPMNISVKLGEFPSKEERASLDNHGDKSSADKSLDGVSVENITPETAQDLKLPSSTTGVVVSEVNPASKAADAGLKQGDVIQQVNHQSVANVHDFSAAIGKSSKDDSVLLLVNRDGNTIFLAV